MCRENGIRHFSIRLAASLAVLLLGAASSQADVFVNGTFTGTFYTGSNNQGGIVAPIDTLGIFGTPGANLTGQTITGTFTYDASTLPLIASGPGYTQYDSPNNGFLTETVNGVSVTFGTNVYMDLFLAEPPYLGSGNVFDLETANEIPLNAVPGDSWTYQYVRVEGISAPFLNGLGNVQQFALPS